MSAKPRRTYSVEVSYMDGWRTVMEGESRGYCLGYMHAYSTAPGPTMAMRVANSTGHEVESIEAVTVVSIGMIAGFPTAEQYERAGNEALERARLIREQAAAREQRRGRTCKSGPWMPLSRPSGLPLWSGAYATCEAAS